jgi:hypothetical protein
MFGCGAEWVRTKLHADEPKGKEPELERQERRRTAGSQHHDDSVAMGRKAVKLAPTLFSERSKPKPGNEPREPNASQTRNWAERA